MVKCKSSTTYSLDQKDIGTVVSHDRKKKKKKIKIGIPNDESLERNTKIRHKRITNYYTCRKVHE